MIRQSPKSKRNYTLCPYTTRFRANGVERRGLDDIACREDPGGEPELVGDPRRGWSDDEDKHNIRAAITLYPLIENAIRGRRGASIPDHLKSMGRLFSGLDRKSTRLNSSH